MYLKWTLLMIGFTASIFMFSCTKEGDTIIDNNNSESGNTTPPRKLL